MNDEANAAGRARPARDAAGHWVRRAPMAAAPSAAMALVTTTCRDPQRRQVVLRNYFPEYTGEMRRQPVLRNYKCYIDRGATFLQEDFGFGGG